MTALAIFFLAIAVVVTSARADGVGFRDISIEVDGERLITALWYPTDAPSGQTAVGPFTMAASREAPIGAGRYGLVVISHGTGGGRLNHRDTSIRLAEERLCRRQLPNMPGTVFATRDTAVHRRIGGGARVN